MSVHYPSPMPGPGNSPEPVSDMQQVVGRVLGVLSQRRWLFIIPLLSGVLLALVVSLFLPRRYVLSAWFERRDDVVITNLITNNSPYSFETLRRSLPIDLAGYNAISQAVTDLQLDADLLRDAQGEFTPEARTARQGIISSLARQIDVNLAEKSTYLDLIEVRYTGNDPELGVRLVTQLKDNYIARTRQRISDILQKSHAFFSQEAAKRKESVARLEAELLQMAVAHPGVDPTDPGVLDGRLLSHATALEELARKRRELETRLQSAQEFLAQLEGAPEATSRPVFLPSRGTPSPKRQRLAQEVESVRMEIANAKALRNMTDLHPTVVALREKLARLEADLSREPEFLTDGELRMEPGAGPDPRTAVADTERKRVKAEIRSLESLLAQVDHDVARHQRERKHLEDEKGKLFERRQAFLVQQQELQSAKADLGIWEKHVDTISRVLAAEAEARGIQFATVDDARRPGKPVSPTLPGILLLSAACGIALATAAVFLREFFDHSLRSVQRAREVLGVPVLETIGEIRTRTRGQLLGRLCAPMVVGALCLLLAAVLGLVYLSVDRPQTYEKLSTRWVALIRH
jgi:uncharacterized protein involved in exopolysaccharide biosynthesis